MSETDLTTTEPEITTLDELDELELEVVAPEVLAKVPEVMGGSAFLPRLQVNGTNTKIVASGKSRPGIFCLVYSGDRFTELDKELVFLSISVRPMALLMPDNANPIAYFDPKSDEFQKVVDQADKGGMSGAMYGPEFLIWIPSQSTFARFFHSSSTLRNVAPQIVQIMRSDPNVPTSPLKPRPVRGRMKFIVGKKFSWWGYEALPESSPLPNFPEGWRENMLKELEKFKNPPKSEVEPAPEPATTDGRVR